MKLICNLCSETVTLLKSLHVLGDNEFMKEQYIRHEDTEV